jgi:hypothetical protein
MSVYNYFTPLKNRTKIVQPKQTGAILMSKVTPKQKLDLMLTGIFFLFIYLYVWLHIRPELIYFNLGVNIEPVFFRTGVLFLRQHLIYPGGPAEYLTALLSQGFLYSSLGAAIITFTVLLLLLAAKCLVKRTSKTLPTLLYYLPVLAVLILCCCYENPLIITVPLLLTLWFSIIFIDIASKNTAVRLAEFIVMFAVLYYLSGGVSILFALLVTAYASVVERRFLLSISYLLAWAITVHIVGVTLFKQLLDEALLALTPFSWRYRSPNYYATPQVLVVLFTLYLYYPLLLVLSLAAKKPCGPKGRKLIYQSVFRIVVLAALCFSSVYLPSFRRKKSLCTLVYFYRNQQWKQLLEYARTIPVNHSSKMHSYLINRALYDTGELLDQMYSYSLPRPGSIMFTSTRASEIRQNLLTCDLFLKLGYVNLAENKAYAVLEELKESPMAMENLVNIYLVKGETENARMALNVLKKDLLYRKRAQHLLKLIEEDRISSIEEISEIRLVKSTIDCFVSLNKTHRLLLNLLESNPGNRRALEYLTADYLITGKLKEAVDNIGRFRDAGYTQLPRHLQEAILISEDIFKEKPDRKGYSITPETRRRFNEFKLILNSADKATAKQKLSPGFGDTYYFHYYFPKFRYLYIPRHR